MTFCTDVPFFVCRADSLALPDPIVWARKLSLLTCMILTTELSHYDPRIVTLRSANPLVCHTL